MNITVVLADDHKIVRDGLRALIEKEPDLGVVAEADEGRSAVQLCRWLRSLLPMSLSWISGCPT